ncbi:hypothetical protein HFO61_03895 [Rhizobium leguminosarum]|uniref:hypothetical protein n=1 Tax=Rhizobium leguminosarum TaxID=384 RepID=UPI001C956CBE|nr:hypothetical protein [Rhizobium leguminosarum]MBY5545990.1 hypothetical protein [Rhizobium leguminosarum]
MDREDIPENLRADLNDTSRIVHSYVQLLFCAGAITQGDPKFRDNHLLRPLLQDLIESAFSLSILAREGMHSVLIRELRFVVEASIKLCFVQQRSYQSSIVEKLETFRKELESPRIPLRDVKLSMLSSDTVRDFTEEAGRLYGRTSSYIHWSASQIQERMDQMEKGNSVGRESQETVQATNDLIRRSLAASLVLVFHSVPEYVAGDTMVEKNGKTIDSYFLQSRYLAEIDAYFDYKHERQKTLNDIKESRAARICF